jgi:hypothetical protein
LRPERGLSHVLVALHRRQHPLSHHTSLARDGLSPLPPCGGG